MLGYELLTSQTRRKTSSYKPKMKIYAIEILGQASKFLKSHLLIFFLVIFFMFVMEVGYGLLIEQTSCGQSAKF